MTECWGELFQAISFSSVQQTHTHSFSSLPWHSREQAVSGDSPGIMAPFHSALPNSLSLPSHTRTLPSVQTPVSAPPCALPSCRGNRGLKRANGGTRPERTGPTPEPKMSIWTKHATFNKPNKQLNTKAWILTDKRGCYLNLHRFLCCP